MSLASILQHFFLDPLLGRHDTPTMKQRKFVVGVWLAVAGPLLFWATLGVICAWPGTFSLSLSPTLAMYLLCFVSAGVLSTMYVVMRIRKKCEVWFCMSAYLFILVGSFLQSGYFRNRSIHTGVVQTAMGCSLVLCRLPVPVLLLGLFLSGSAIILTSINEVFDIGMFLLDYNGQHDKAAAGVDALPRWFILVASSMLWIFVMNAIAAIYLVDRLLQRAEHKNTLAIKVSKATALALSLYDTEQVRAMLALYATNGEDCDKDLHQAFLDIASNLEEYRGYLPNWLLLEEEEEEYEEEEEDAEDSTGRDGEQEDERRALRIVIDGGADDHGATAAANPLLKGSFGGGGATAAVRRSSLGGNRRNKRPTSIVLNHSSSSHDVVAPSPSSLGSVNSSRDSVLNKSTGATSVPATPTTTGGEATSTGQHKTANQQMLHDAIADLFSNAASDEAGLPWADRVGKVSSRGTSESPTTTTTTTIATAGANLGGGHGEGWPEVGGRGSDALGRLQLIGSQDDLESMGASSSDQGSVTGGPMVVRTRPSRLVRSNGGRGGAPGDSSALLQPCVSFVFSGKITVASIDFRPSTAGTSTVPLTRHLSSSESLHSGSIRNNREQLINAFVDLIAEVATALHGAIHTVVGDTATLSWNATQRVSQPELKAMRCLEKLREQEDTALCGLQLSAAISTGRALCFSAGSNKKFHSVAISASAAGDNWVDGNYELLQIARRYRTVLCDLPTQEVVKYTMQLAPVDVIQFSGCRSSGVYSSSSDPTSTISPSANAPSACVVVEPGGLPPEDVLPTPPSTAAYQSYPPPSLTQGTIFEFTRNTPKGKPGGDASLTDNMEWMYQLEADQHSMAGRLTKIFETSLDNSAAVHSSASSRRFVPPSKVTSSSSGRSRLVEVHTPIVSDYVQADADFKALLQEVEGAASFFELNPMCSRLTRKVSDLAALQQSRVVEGVVDTAGGHFKKDAPVTSEGGATPSQQRTLGGGVASFSPPPMNFVQPWYAVVSGHDF